jgi:hypothetical protein
MYRAINGTCQANRQTTNKIRRKIMKSSKLPIQSAPVVRTATGVPVSSGNGVEASGWMDILGGIAKVALPALGGALGLP